MSKPIFLEGYDVFARLGDWTREPEVQGFRHWEMRSHLSSRHVECSLQWEAVYPSGPSYSKSWIARKVATSPEEAVWLALEEYKTWKANYERSLSTPPSSPRCSPGGCT